jgi:hypothetical protein
MNDKAKSMKLVRFRLSVRNADATSAIDVHPVYVLTGIEVDVTVQAEGKPAMSFSYMLPYAAYEQIAEIIRTETLKVMGE